MSMTRRNQKVYLPDYGIGRMNQWSKEIWEISQEVFYWDTKNKYLPNEYGMIKITFSVLLKVLKNRPDLKKALKSWY